MSDQSKERDVKIGLANNLFGAAAGGVATAQAGVAARGAWKNRNLSPEQQKKAAEKAKSSPGKARTVFRKLPEGVQKPVRAAAKSRWTVPGLAVGNVAMQLANGGMDGQSAQYFGRELRDMKREQKESAVKKSDSQSLGDFYERPERSDGTVGTNLNSSPPEPVSKEILYATPKEKNPHRSRNNAGAAALAVGAAGAGGYGAKQFRDIDRQVGDARRSVTKPNAMKDLKIYTATENGQWRNRTDNRARVADTRSLKDMGDPSSEARSNARLVTSNPKKYKPTQNLYADSSGNSAEALKQHTSKYRKGRAAAAAAVGLAGAAAAAHKIGGSKERNRWT